MENKKRDPFAPTPSEAAAFKLTDAEQVSWKRITEAKAKGASAGHNTQKPQKPWRPFERLRKLTGWALLGREREKEAVRTNWALGFPPRLRPVQGPKP